MLSAVENFGSAAAAASHASYAHHNPFAIAAAAAAAGTAAAAAVMPSHQSAALEHHHHMLSHSSLGSAGILMPSAQLTALPSSEGTTRNLQSSQLPITNKLNNNSIAAPVAVAMSSAEFVRPHPKQPRYSSSSNNNNNNNHNNNNNTSSNTNSSNNNNNNNNNGSSNGIPLHLRSNKVGNSCLSNTPSLRTKYSTEQAGPVNLVTSNNNNINNNGSSSNIKSTSSPPIKSPSLESIPQAPSDRDIIAGMYAQKMSFASNVSNEVAAAYHQYSRMYQPNRSIYGEPSMYAAHHQIARSQLHGRPTYLTDQFSGYLHPSPGVYSPAEPPSTLLRHQPPPQSTQQQQQQQQHSLGSHNASNLLNNSHNNSTNINNTSLCTTQLPVMSDRHPHSSSSLHHSNSNNNNHHLPQPPSLVGLDRQQQQILSSHAKDKDPKNLVCLNGKVPANSAGFKVPSGKEGSLKHRILTRPPYGEKDIGRHRSSIAATVVRNSTNNNSPTNFTKGSLIELSTGELRRVEDMRTEDFVQSAERSVHLELADSTVVKIANTPHSVMITFSYNKNRSKVDIDASVDHPFFVYGQGWASCNPELTLKSFGLKCQRLQVGDVCISLKPRESSSYSAKPQSPTTYTQPVQHYKDEMAPQNLSRKSSSLSSLASTIPTTATATAVSSRLSVPMPQHLPPPTSIMSHLPVQSYEMLQSYGTSPSASSHQLHHLSSNVVSHPQHHHHPHHMQRQPKADDRFIVTRNNGDCQASPSPPAISTSRPPSNQPYYLGTMVDKRSTNGGRGSNNSAESNHSAASDHQAAIDASSSRKRRWSWSDPVNNCDEDGPPTHKTICNSNS